MWSTFIRNLRLLENNIDWSALRYPDTEAVGDRYNARLEYLQSTAAGIDGLLAWLLRVAAPIFCKTIAYLINMSLATSAPGLHQLLACDLVQNLVYQVQLHHCTKARYAYATCLMFQYDNLLISVPKTKHITSHFCVVVAERIITHSSPISVVIDLESSSVVISTPD